jgi:diguanylate cyclase (GGDEF)-like protein
MEDVSNDEGEGTVSGAETRRKTAWWSGIVGAIAAALLALGNARRAQRREARLKAENERLRRLALTDDLTGLPNRRHFLHRLEEAIAFARRRNLPVALVILDLDHFKVINDRYGHPSGDRVLEAVAEALVADARAEDLVARYGGEEFGIVLQGTDLEGARVRAERLRARIAGIAVAVKGGARIGLTASFGVAAIPESCAPRAHRLIAAADGALYAAKRAGRNRCVAAPSVQRSGPAPLADPEGRRGPGAMTRPESVGGCAPPGSLFRSI